MKRMIFALLIIALTFAGLEGYTFFFSTSQDSLHGLILALKAKVKEATHGLFGRIDQLPLFLRDQEAIRGLSDRLIADGNNNLYVSPETHRPYQRRILKPFSILETPLIRLSNETIRILKIPGLQVKNNNLSRYKQSLL